jgi:hypothetical protein
MPWNLLLLPLLGGYLFLRLSSYHQFRSQRFEGNRLTLESSAYGVAFLLLGRLMSWLLGSIVPESMLAGLERTFPLDFIGTGVLALLCGPACAWIRNARETVNEAKRKALEDMEEGLLAFCQGALLSKELILLSMSNRKVYAGRVISCPGLNPKDAYLRLLPFLSGHRDPSDLRVRFTLDYASLHELGVEKFVILLPISGIESACTFDMEIYQKHFEAPRLAPS